MRYKAAAKGFAEHEKAEVACKDSSILVFCPWRVNR